MKLAGSLLALFLAFLAAAVSDATDSLHRATATNKAVWQLRAGEGVLGRRGRRAAAARRSPPSPPPLLPPPPPPSVAAVVSGGTATIPNEIFNLVKAIVGVGVLSLPAGIANFGNSGSVLVPALLLITAIGILSANGFAIIGKVCSFTGATSYRDAWSRSVGPNTSWIPAISTTLKTFLACLAFSMVLADTFTGLFQRAPDERTMVLATLTVALLFPLCWMKNLSSLAPFSLAGVLGMAYTALAMTVRWLDGSYGKGGKLRELVADHLQPSFGSAGWKSVLQPNALILVCMLSTAYMAHFNAPKFYNELQNNTLPRFHSVVAASFGLSIALMGFITAVGFLTFGASCSGLVLNNYASTDILMGASRVAVAVSLVFSYPLAFQGCRDGVLDVLQVPSEKRSNSFLNMTTVALLGTLTFLAAVLKDVSFVLAFGGATLGNALTYVYPAIMYSAIVKKQNRKDESLGVIIANLSSLLGIVMGLIGAKMALEK